MFYKRELMIKPFVDRVKEIEQLSEALRYDQRENTVLVFKGRGGAMFNAVYDLLQYIEE